MSSFNYEQSFYFLQAKVQGYIYHWALSPALDYERILGGSSPAKAVWQRRCYHHILQKDWYRMALF